MTPTDTVARTWSSEQHNIFGWFEGTSNIVDLRGHLVVRARAGCGKTTTIIEGCNRALETNILVCAFAKKNVEDFLARVTNAKVTIKTLHGVGCGIVMRYWQGIRVCKGHERADALTEAVCGSGAPDAIKRLVTKLHTKGRENAPHATTGGDLLELARTFECEPDESWQAEGWSIDYVTARAAAAMILAAARKPVETGIDYADMIFLPVRNHWLAKKYDLAVVDETQDMTRAQLEIVEGVCKGRICIVGDDKQAIYGFRGADVGGMDRLKAKLSAGELGLTTTYRCGRSIVKEAQSLVPDFTAGPDNPEGLVSCLAEQKLVDTAQEGDFVLSRSNAPLISTAMALLRAGKRTKIAGRDIGAGLKAIIRRLAKGRAGSSIPALMERIKTWGDQQVARAVRAGREDKVDMIRDQEGMLAHLAQHAVSVSDLDSRIDALFTDDGLGAAGLITCSTVHRAKGLEANRVFVLAATLKNHTPEEQNIRYVAITRAKQHLVWVL